MNICAKQVIWLFFLLSCCLGKTQAQALFNVKAGAETWSFQDEKEQTGSSLHPGQLFGFDVFLEKNRALFVPGFHYHRISVINEDHSFSFDFSEAHHMHYLTIPMTGGYMVVDDSIFTLAVLAGGEIQFFYDLDQNDVGLDDDMFYGVTTALTAIVHTTLFSFLTTEVKYHYGLQPTLKERDDSKLRGWTLAVGVKF